MNHTAGSHSRIPLHNLELWLLALGHYGSPLILLRVIVIVIVLRGHFTGYWEWASVCTKLLRILWALLGWWAQWRLYCRSLLQWSVSLLSFFSQTILVLSALLRVLLRRRALLRVWLRNLHLFALLMDLRPNIVLRILNHVYFGFLLDVLHFPFKVNFRNLFCFQNVISLC